MECSLLDRRFTTRDSNRISSEYKSHTKMQRRTRPSPSVILMLKESYVSCLSYLHDGQYFSRELFEHLNNAVLLVTAGVSAASYLDLCREPCER
jgi:hypothetical protein